MPKDTLRTMIVLLDDIKTLDDVQEIFDKHKEFLDTNPSFILRCEASGILMDATNKEKELLGL